MEIVVIWLIILLIIQWALGKKEKEMLIRELTKSLKSKDIKEYAEVIPEDEVVIAKEPNDQFINMEDVDPRELLKAIKE